MSNEQRVSKKANHLDIFIEWNFCPSMFSSMKAIALVFSPLIFLVSITPPPHDRPSASVRRVAR